MNERLVLIQAALRERIAESGFGCVSCGDSFAPEKKIHLVVASSSLDGGGELEVFFKCGDCVESDGSFSSLEKEGI